MSISDRQLLHDLSQMPLVDIAELAMILGGGPRDLFRGLTELLSEGMVGRVSHGTALLWSNRRYYLTDQGVGEAAGVLGFYVTFTLR